MSPDSRELAAQVRGPLILITIGVLFLLDRFTPFGFSETWPVIIIVVGLLALMGGTKRRDRGPGVPPGVPPNGPTPGGWR
jgi:hypothetical protein